MQSLKELNTPKGYLTVRQYAERFGLDPQRLSRLINERKIPYKRVGPWYFISRNTKPRNHDKDGILKD